MVRESEEQGDEQACSPILQMGPSRIQQSRMGLFYLPILGRPLSAEGNSQQPLLAGRGPGPSREKPQDTAHLLLVWVDEGQQGKW